MKKLLYVVVAVCLCFGLIPFSVPTVSAVSPTMAPSSSPVPAVTPKPIEYVLPYPGLLPTHPLYFIKNLRDTVIEILITDTVSKADFYILQADKKLNMGVVLASMKKEKDADAAFTQAITSRVQAVSLLESYKTSGGAVPGYLMEKLFLSIDKHTEVLRTEGMKTDPIVALRVRAEKLRIQTP